MSSVTQTPVRQGLLKSMQEMVDADEDEFREEIEHVLSMAGLDVHECLADGTTVMRREGIDPD